MIWILAPFSLNFRGKGRSNEYPDPDPLTLEKIKAITGKFSFHYFLFLIKNSRNPLRRQSDKNKTGFSKE
jgi:hypothetical protein